VRESECVRVCVSMCENVRRETQKVWREWHVCVRARVGQCMKERECVCVCVGLCVCV